MLKIKKLNYILFLLIFLSHCSFIGNSSYSFYETFINPEASKYSNGDDNEQDKPNLDSVPANVDLNE